jgi:hypothetical protein
VEPAVLLKMPRLHDRVTEDTPFDSNISGVKSYIVRSFKRVKYERSKVMKRSA